MKRLSAEIDRRRDDLVETTRELIRIPTLNPPGDHYRDICDYLEARLARSGFSSTFVRARARSAIQTNIHAGISSAAMKAPATATVFISIPTPMW